MVAKLGPRGCVFGMLEVRGSRLDLGDEGGRLPRCAVSPASCCLHGLGGVVDALSEAPAAPERGLHEGGPASAQTGFRGA
jgi:hypothetical protein